MACSSCVVLPAEGKARLVDRHTVEVTLPDGGKRRLTTKNILLAQGGKPIKADVPGKVNVQLDCHEHPCIAAICGNGVMCLHAFLSLN